VKTAVQSILCSTANLPTWGYTRTKGLSNSFQRSEGGWLIEIVRIVLLCG